MKKQSFTLSIDELSYLMAFCLSNSYPYLDARYNWRLACLVEKGILKISDKKPLTARLVYVEFNKESFAMEHTLSELQSEDYRALQRRIA